MKVRIKHLTKLNPKQLLELEACEKKVFKEGGLNRWTLPVIARYGFLFSLCRHPKSPSPHGGEGRGEGDIIGLASFIAKKNTAFLVGLWVDKAYRGRGFAQKLLSQALSELNKSGIDNAELTVDEKNEPALKLYREAGFKIERNLQSFYGPQQNRLLLRNNLVE